MTANTMLKRAGTRTTAKDYDLSPCPDPYLSFMPPWNCGPSVMNQQIVSNLFRSINVYRGRHIVLVVSFAAGGQRIPCRPFPGQLGNHINNNNNGRNGSCLTWLATSLEEKRRWLITNASPRGQCTK